jgi:hypothetical protein
MVEESVLLLAKAAGHDVTNEQYLVTTIIDGNAVTGRMDAVIDNVLVDVKSCSPFGFKKFEQGLTEENDDFGYLTQLSLYNGATAPGFKRQGFLAVDKQNGRIGFFEVPWKDPYDKAYQMIQDAKKLTWPPRAFDDEPDGASGNRKLCTTCSYCPYKQTCWPGLKAYSYSGHPRFLTVVKRVPGVPEIELKKAA